MGEKLQEKLVQYLEAGERAIREAGPVVGGEVEQLVREWLTWMMLENIGHSLACLVVAVVPACVIRIVWKATEKMDGEDKWIPRSFAGGLLGIILVVAAGRSALYAGEAVKAKVAPRVVVLEKVSELVKSSGKH